MGVVVVDVWRDGDVLPLIFSQGRFAFKISSLRI